MVRSLPSQRGQSLSLNQDVVLNEHIIFYDYALSKWSKSENFIRKKISSIRNELRSKTSFVIQNNTSFHLCFPKLEWNLCILIKYLSKSPIWFLGQKVIGSHTFNICNCYWYFWRYVFGLFWMSFYSVPMGLCTRRIEYVIVYFTFVLSF